MEIQIVINLLNNTSNQLSKFKAKNWVEINEESRGTYSVNSEIRFRNAMLKSSLFVYRSS